MINNDYSSPSTAINPPVSNLGGFKNNRPPPMVVKDSEYFSSMTSPVSSNY